MAKTVKESEIKEPVKKRALILLLVMFLIFLFVASLFGDKGFLEVCRARIVHTEIVSEIDELKTENEQLVKEITELKNSSGIIEKIAREDLKMAKEGEDLFIFID